MVIFFNFSPTSIILIHYKSRIATAIRGVLWMKMTMVNSGSMRRKMGLIQIFSLKADFKQI